MRVSRRCFFRHESGAPPETRFHLGTITSAYARSQRRLSACRLRHGTRPAHGNKPRGQRDGQPAQSPLAGPGGRPTRMIGQLTGPETTRILSK